jgi:hypothetical protein
MNRLGARRSRRSMRSFDPRRVGRLECAAWVNYYRREWLRLLAAALALTRESFNLSWPATLLGAWLVLRANQLWAPSSDNDPDGARRAMQRFYGLVKRRYGEVYDPVHAAALEVEWWRVHREHQRSGSELDEQALIEALAALYAYVYDVPVQDVRMAAEQRALAMRYSDTWVSEGCEIRSPLLALERTALVRSYAGLLAAVYRPAGGLPTQLPHPAG